MENLKEKIKAKIKHLQEEKEKASDRYQNDDPIHQSFHKAIIMETRFGIEILEDLIEEEE